MFFAILPPHINSEPSRVLLSTKIPGKLISTHSRFFIVVLCGSLREPVFGDAFMGVGRYTSRIGALCVRCVD